MSPLKLQQGKAEAMEDVAEGSHDIIMCANLLSEMPADARRQAIMEMYRAVAPGGIVIVGDALQDGDIQDKRLAELLG